VANVDIDNPIGFVDKRRVSNTSNALVGTPANYFSAGAMRTRLAAANGAYFTAARLDQMSENDLVYALRTIDDAGSL
jgi:hypothetical protein